MFALWDEKIPFAIEKIQRPEGIEHITIHDTFEEEGACIFLHGVAIEKFHGTYFANWGNNWGIENSVTEVLRGKRSRDGRIWKQLEQISPPGVPYGVSHGVYWRRGDQLRTLAAHFLGGDVFASFGGLRCDSFLWDEKADKWLEEGTVADNFWPLCPPVKMDNGNYIMAGCDKNWRAAVAISQGENTDKWCNISLHVGEKVYTEAACWVCGSRITVLMRNETDLRDGVFTAAVAVSEDFGESFGPCVPSNLPMANSKPFAGRLCDGRGYLVYNYPLRGKYDRGCLLLALTRPGEEQLSSVFELERWDGGLAYPYAIEADGRLYVTYSARCARAEQGLNLNDARLAVVPLSAI